MSIRSKWAVRAAVVAAASAGVLGLAVGPAAASQPFSQPFESQPFSQPFGSQPFSFSIGGEVSLL